MNQDDEYEGWLRNRRNVVPPADLTDRIMAAIESPVSLAQQPKTSPGPLARLGPVVLCTAASLIFIARITALVGNLVFPTGSYPEFAEQQIEEFPHDHRSVERS